MAFGDQRGPANEFKTFGEALKYWRKKRGWTLETAAKAFSLDATYLSRIERGPHDKYKPPEIFPTAFQWAERLGLWHQPYEHAQFIELAVRDRFESNALEAMGHDSGFRDLWWWFSRRSTPPMDEAPTNTVKGIASVHECIGRVAEAAVENGPGDLGFRPFGDDGSWDIWRIEKPTPPTPKKSRKKGGSKRRSK